MVATKFEQFSALTDAVYAAFKEKPQKNGYYPRHSSSDACPRQQSLFAAGFQRSNPVTERMRVRLGIGDAIEDMAINWMNTNRLSVRFQQLSVAYELPNGVKVSGSIDGMIFDAETKEFYLMDVKSIEGGKFSGKFGVYSDDGNHAPKKGNVRQISMYAHSVPVLPDYHLSERRKAEWALLFASGLESTKLCDMAIPINDELYFFGGCVLVYVVLGAPVDKFERGEPPERPCFFPVLFQPDMEEVAAGVDLHMRVLAAQANGEIISEVHADDVWMGKNGPIRCDAKWCGWFDQCKKSGDYRIVGDRA